MLGSSPNASVVEGSALATHSVPFAPCATDPPSQSLGSIPQAAASINNLQNGRPWCEISKKPNRTLETCWRIHGKSVNWKPAWESCASSATIESTSHDQQPCCDNKAIEMIPLWPVARSLHFNIPNHFWGDVVLTTTCFINWMPSRILLYKTPNHTLQSFATTHLFHGITLKIFGCLLSCICMVVGNLILEQSNPFTLGIPRLKRDKCYSVTRRFYNSMDVTFSEHGPFHPKSSI